MKLPLRFNLKTLLVALTLCAITYATIWQFWPRYRAYQARQRFEAAAARLHPGMSLDDTDDILGHGAWNSYSSDARGNTVGLSPHFLDGAWYCVYVELDRDSGENTCGLMPSKSIKVYRLAVPPPNYSPQTRAARDTVNPPETVRTHKMTPKGVIDIRAPRKEGEEARRAAYIQDFEEHIAQRTKKQLKISYQELPQSATTGNE